jgi:hypothetical protein
MGHPNLPLPMGYIYGNPFEEISFLDHDKIGYDNIGSK